MINLNEYEVYLTNAKGEKENRTTSIAEINHHEFNPFYIISFTNNPNKKYTYPEDRVEIIENCLNKENCKTVYEYLRAISCFSEIRNDKGENLLTKNFPEDDFINTKSVLHEYLNPNVKSVKKHFAREMIFPFGCNNSQYDAVINALENSISIIQGPPGTGKTQTILNIIANLLIQKKSVLIVSNNNDAIKNVQEKLAEPKYGLDFLCACLGKRDNVEDFICEQVSEYPKDLFTWGTLPNVDLRELQNEIERIKKYYTSQEDIAKLQTEISEIEQEKLHYELEENEELPFVRKRFMNCSSGLLMDIWQEIQYKFSNRKSLSLFYKLKLYLFYGIGSKKFWITKDASVFHLIKKIYYQRKLQELNQDLEYRKHLLTYYDAKSVYDNSLIYLKKDIYKRYCNKEKTIFSDAKEISSNFKSFLDEYPIVFSTTFSSRKCLPYRSRRYLYDYVIMDEASQVDVVSGALALSCAKNCVIVGDKMQLPNVVEESTCKKADSILEKANIANGYSLGYSLLESIEMIIPNIPQTLLREHYRCHPKIIDFCNKYFYHDKLIIMTEDRQEENVINAIRTVPGNHCNGNYNQRQIDVVQEEILPSLSMDGEVPYDSIGVVTPYNEQVNNFKRCIPQLDTATVHKFQGREKDTIIISTVDNTIRSFTDNPNLLNVAISRAKKNLYVIISGNQQSKNTNIMNLVSYIEYEEGTATQSKVHSVYDYLYKQYSKERFNYLRYKRKISKYDSENITYNLLLEILAQDDFSQFEVVFEYPLKNLLNLKFNDSMTQEEIQYINNDFSHIDFALFNKVDKRILGALEVDGYTFHKVGTKQHIRDVKKNHILELYSIPILRLSTKESNIKMKLKNWLRDLVN